MIREQPYDDIPLKRGIDEGKEIIFLTPFRGNEVPLTMCEELQEVVYNFDIRLPEMMGWLESPTHQKTFWRGALAPLNFFKGVRLWK